MFVSYGFSYDKSDNVNTLQQFAIKGKNFHCQLCFQKAKKKKGQLPALNMRSQSRSEIKKFATKIWQV